LTFLLMLYTNRFQKEDVSAGQVADTKSLRVMEILQDSQNKTRMLSLMIHEDSKNFVCKGITVVLCKHLCTVFNHGEEIVTYNY